MFHKNQNITILSQYIANDLRFLAFFHKHTPSNKNQEALDWLTCHEDCVITEGVK